MSEDSVPVSKFLKNPLVPAEADATGVFRLVAQPARPKPAHEDVQPLDRFDVGIEFAKVLHGVVLEQGSKHSLYMTSEVLGVAPERLAGLTRDQVEELFSEVETAELHLAA
jgi:hypothetical protein